MVRKTEHYSWSQKTQVEISVPQLTYVIIVYTLLKLFKLKLLIQSEINICATLQVCCEV